MVGRQTELRRLGDAYQQAERNRSCQLFTILGSAGVGKSRLAAEFQEGVDATVVQGRCLPYGEGITYWPVIEVIRQLPKVEPDHAVSETLRSLLDGTATAAPADEIAWAFRKLIEAAARERPLVVVFDDLQWGEETFLDLIEHVADLTRDAPILLLCMARPDLLDRRPTWAGGKLNATNVLLEPLSATETHELIAQLTAALPGDTFRQVVEAAEGNPLFVEEMVALARESGAGHVSVPPTIQALLAARLDQLDDGERAVLECGAIEGRTFHLGAVQALAPDHHDVVKRLTSLVRKELIRPDTSRVPTDEAFRFRHLLIRDAAYDALPKSTRADLHERFARWLEEHASGVAELDEILGYHLEQACRYRRELGQQSDEELASRARRHLITAGRRAYARADFGAAVALFERASALLSPGALDVALSVDLINALTENGRSDDAMLWATSLAERARFGWRSWRRAVWPDPGRHNPHLPRGITGGRHRLPRRAGRGRDPVLRGQARRPWAVCRLSRSGTGGQHPCAGQCRRRCLRPCRGIRPPPGPCRPVSRVAILVPDPWGNARVGIPVVV